MDSCTRIQLLGMSDFKGKQIFLSYIPIKKKKKSQIIYKYKKYNPKQTQI